MNEIKKSDPLIVAMKRTNKGPTSPAESLERRGGTEGNSIRQSICRTQSWEKVSQATERVRIAAKRKDGKLTCLLHHVSVEALHLAYLYLNRGASAGVDHLTWKEYGENLVQNLFDLHRRVHTTPRTQWQTFGGWHNVSNYNFTCLNVHLNLLHQ